MVRNASGKIKQARGEVDLCAVCVAQKYILLFLVPDASKAVGFLTINYL